MQETGKMKAALREFFQMIVIPVALALFCGKVLIVNANIPSGSMENTIHPGDRVIGSRLAYLSQDPQRSDIIIFKFPDDESQVFIKRIIGLPGETVQVVDGCAYIDGELLESDIYGAELMEDSGIAGELLTLKEDEYFVLGDNRNHSSDSRDPSVGILTREDLLGKAWVRIYPFDKMGVIRHE